MSAGVRKLLRTDLVLARVALEEKLDLRQLAAAGKQEPVSLSLFLEVTC